MTPEEIAAFRLTMGHWSQRELAERLGVSTRCVEEWEGARRTPPPYLRLVFAAINSGLEPWPD